MTQVKPIQLLLLVLIISSATLNAQVPQNAEDISPLLIGEKLPEAMLLDEDGKPINLNEDIAKNKNVLLRYNIESEVLIIKINYEKKTLYNHNYIFVMYTS